LQSKGPKAGVLSNEAAWNTIMGPSYTIPNSSTNTLWWANYTNGGADYVGWNINQFGGWALPVMHQYVSCC